MPMIKTLSPTSQLSGTAHISSAVEDLAQPHTCPYEDCRKTFSKKYNLKAHLRMHTGEKPFVCPRKTCAKKFKWRSSLSSHTIWHERQDAEAQERSRQVSGADVKKGSDEGRVDARTGAATEAGKVTGAGTGGVTGAGVGRGYPAEQWQGINRKRPRKALAPLDLRSVDEACVVVGTDAFSVESQSKRRKTDAQNSESSRGSPSERELPHHIQNPHQQLPAPTAREQSGVEQLKLPLELLESANTGEKSPKFDDNQMKSLAYLTLAPGSPVTSDGGYLSEQSLDLDIFDSFSSSDIEFEDELREKQFALNALKDSEKEEAEGFFGSNSPILACASPSCANVNPMDRCFKDCELESLQTFYSSNQDLGGSVTFLSD